MPRFCGLLRTFVVKMLQFAFAHFCGQIHQKAKIWGLQGVGDQAILSSARILKDIGAPTPPLPHCYISEIGPLGLLFLQVIKL